MGKGCAYGTQMKKICNKKTLHPPPVHHFSCLNFQICFHHSATSKLLLSLSSNRKPAKRANEDKVSKNLGHLLFLLEHLMLILHSSPPLLTSTLTHSILSHASSSSLHHSSSLSSHFRMIYGCDALLLGSLLTSWSRLAEGLTLSHFFSLLIYFKA